MRDKNGRFIKKGVNKIIYQDNKILKFLVESSKHGEKEVIIDTEDWDKVKQYHWHINLNGNNFYVVTDICNIEGHSILRLHRLVLNLLDNKIEIDHKFHNTLDNRKENLRICTHKNNSRNVKRFKNNVSGYKGVYWRKDTKKWQVSIRYGNKLIHLGYFTDILEAAKKYNYAAIKYFGEFACLNEVN